MPVLTGVTVKGSKAIRLLASCALQQPAALRPFMREFIKLLLIACGTRRNNVGDIIAPPSRKRDHMVSVPYKTLLGMALSAVIAAVTLAFNLFLELLRGKRLSTTNLSSATFMVDCLPDCLAALAPEVRFSDLSATLRLAILDSVDGSPFFMILVPLSSMYPLFFPVALIVPRVIAASFFFMLLLPFRISHTALFFMILMPLFIFCACACFALISVCCSVLVEESQRVNLSTDAALFALRAVERYTGIHDKACSLSSRLRMFAASLGHHIYASFYHTSASKATLCSFYCPASNFLEA